MNLLTIYIRLTKATRPIGLWLLFVYVSVTGAIAGETNRYFVTTTPFDFTPPQTVEEAKRAPESRPAEDDPEGNWGGVVEGFQLSLRFKKITFAVGEPIMATVLLRNVSIKRLGYLAMRGPSFDTSYGNFVVIKDPRILIPRLRSDNPDGSVMNAEMEPGTQYKAEARLDTLYDLSAPGSYLIYIKHPVFREDGNSVVDVLSGNASINIIAAPKTAGSANPANTATTTSSSPAALANSGTPSVVGKAQTANSLPLTSAAKPKSIANTPKNILQPTPKAAANKSPAQLAQAETGGGFSRRDWVFGLLVLGLVLGLGGLLFRARAPRR